MIVVRHHGLIGGSVTSWAYIGNCEKVDCLLIILDKHVIFSLLLSRLPLAFLLQTLERSKDFRRIILIG